MRQLTAHILRLLYSAYVPEPVRNSLRLQLLLLRRDVEPARSDAPQGRIIVLAPHMDDEVFGCGGTLALSAKRGNSVTVVYITDGSKGYPASAMAGKSTTELREAERQLSARRKEEGRRAATILGLETPVCLDLPDAALAVTSEAVARLASVLTSLTPEIVFLPFLTDLHHDHWLTNCLFVEAAAAANMDARVPCWGYEVWNPVVANVVVDVTDVYPAKLAAISEFESQRAEYDYLRGIVGLNTYRSLLRGRGHGYAEAFHVGELGVYRRLYEQIVIRRLGGRP
jgi:LmbE family N-acetylglucosaminyl deacetylase